MCKKIVAFYYETNKPKNVRESTEGLRVGVGGRAIDDVCHVAVLCDVILSRDRPCHVTRYSNLPATSRATPIFYHPLPKLTRKSKGLMT
ncbi:unnamed protein product [Prunus armeniaca]|uniref:Uncharacterized protein n=1 Tax=Prunus armeniaca TaxID=36596 RepID=A0A6J5W9V1_PRUAR|nr:unnamed protein product [Prunus armeniaca]